MTGGMTVAVTRPRDSEDELTELLHARGYGVIHEPLSRIILNHTAQTALMRAIAAEPDAVLATSRHGVHALAALCPSRDLSLLCVGEATARAAESAGFTRIAAAGGTVRQMLEYILASYDAGSRMLYVSGEHVRMDLADALEDKGFPTQRVALYEAPAAEAFSSGFVEYLKHGNVDAVTFLSPRAAEIFTALIRQARLESSLAGLAACALSEAVAEPLVHGDWKKICIAGKPTLASLVACVDNTLS